MRILTRVLLAVLFAKRFLSLITEDSPLIGRVFRWDRRELLRAATMLKAASPRHVALAAYLARIAKSPDADRLIAELDCLAGRDFANVPTPKFYGLLAACTLLLALVGTWAAQGFRPPRDWLKTRLPGLVVTKVEQGHGRFGVGVDADGMAITVNGTAVVNALGTHAPSTIQLRRDKGINHVRGKCAYPDRQLEGRVVCRVLSDGTPIFVSPPLTASNRLAAFDVAVGGQVTLEIRSLTDSINNAHGVWLDLEGYP